MFYLSIDNHADNDNDDDIMIAYISDHHRSVNPDRPFLRSGRGHSVMTVALPPYLRPIDEEEIDDEDEEEETTKKEETFHSYDQYLHRYYYYYDYDEVVNSFEDDENGCRKEYGWRLTRSAHKSAAGDICPSAANGNLSLTVN